MAGEPRQTLFQQPHQQIFAGEVIDDDDRPAGNANPAHFRGEPRRIAAPPRRRRAPALRRTNCPENWRFSASMTCRPSTCESLRRAVRRLALSSISADTSMPVTRNLAGNAEATARCRRRPRESADPADRWRCARPPFARDETPDRRQCRRSRRTADRCGSCPASPSGSLSSWSQRRLRARSPTAAPTALINLPRRRSCALRPPRVCQRLSPRRSTIRPGSHRPP